MPLTSLVLRTEGLVGRIFPGIFFSVALLLGGPSFAAPAGLEVSRDTIYGVAMGQWDASDPSDWTAERFLRIRNRGADAVTLDSLSHPPIYRYDPTDPRPYALEFPWTFAVHVFPAPYDSIRPSAFSGWKAPTLAPGDSVDIGLFQVGMITVPKRSAEPFYQGTEGDSITVPFAIHAAGDSLSFTLKARITNWQAPGGVRGARRKAGRYGAGAVSGLPSTRIDGRGGPYAGEGKNTRPTFLPARTPAR